MEALAMPVAEEAVESSAWGDAAPPKIEEQEFDMQAFELWHRGSCPDLASDEEWLVGEGK